MTLLRDLDLVGVAIVCCSVSCKGSLFLDCAFIREENCLFTIPVLGCRECQKQLNAIKFSLGWVSLSRNFFAPSQTNCFILSYSPTTISDGRIGDKCIPRSPVFQNQTGYSLALSGAQMSWIATNRSFNRVR